MNAKLFSPFVEEVHVGFLEGVFEVVSDEHSDWHLAVYCDALEVDCDVTVGLQHYKVQYCRL